MTGVEYNQGTQRFNYWSSQNKVITCSNHNLNETEIFTYGTSNDQFLETRNDESSFSDNSIYEVSHAAETLVKMAHDTSNFPNNYSDFGTLFGFQDQRYLRVSEEMKGKLCCARIDDCGLLSNSLCAVSGMKKGLEDALTYDHYLPALDYVAMKRRKCEMGSFDSFSKVPQNNVDANYDANVQLTGSTLTNTMLNCKCDKIDDARGDLISPTNHKRFGFSIIHLISAVRLALVAPTCNGSLSYVNITGSDTVEEVYLSVDEIVEQVRLRPGDSRILQSKVHLADLIRGALRIFSSETSPFEAEFWNPLAVYEKSRKGWAWIGPVPCLQLEQLNSIASCTPEFWGFPKDVLVKLVDCFADWLRANMNVLKRRASLPPRPLAFTLFKVNSKERFLGRQTSKGCHPTIKPSIGDIRAYFRAEERIRYMTPDRAYAYTSADGRKSSVAPVKKCGEKQSKRTQTHFLRGDRPSSITILTIVRDAAARLPGRIGTRGDVAVLVRDSQYLLDGISDEQMSHVVSGGLDRLHYERDPCVRFDKQRKLWVYLHGDREEEDFDDDGRQSRVTRWKIKDKQYSRIEV